MTVHSVIYSRIPKENCEQGPTDKDDCMTQSKTTYPFYHSFVLL